MRTVLIAVELVVVLFGPLALAVTASKRYKLAHGVNPDPAYPGDDPLVTPGAVIVGSLAGWVLIAVFSAQVSEFNDWVLRFL